VLEQIVVDVPPSNIVFPELVDTVIVVTDGLVILYSVLVEAHPQLQHTESKFAIVAAPVWTHSVCGVAVLKSYIKYRKSSSTDGAYRNEEDVNVGLEPDLVRAVEAANIAFKSETLLP